jgi:hypothetical protein
MISRTILEARQKHETNSAFTALERTNPARHWWLILIILATWEAETQRITVEVFPGK